MTQRFYANLTWYAYRPWHPAHSHRPFLTLTNFSHLAKQCLLCAFTSVLWTPRPILAMKLHTHIHHERSMMHPARCCGLLLTYTSFSPLAEQRFVCALALFLEQLQSANFLLWHDVIQWIIATSYYTTVFTLSAWTDKPKQKCRPRSDPAECAIRSRLTLFAN